MSNWVKRVGFADHHGVVLEVDFEDSGTSDEGERAASVSVSMGIGPCQSRGFPTKEACRQIAAALLDAADGMDRAEQEAEA